MSAVLTAVKDQIRGTVGSSPRLLADAEAYSDTGKQRKALKMVRCNLPDDSSLPTRTMADILRSPEPVFDPVFSGFWDMKDKLALIGPSKTGKSFCMLQASVCIAIGKDFLIWTVPQRRRVLLCQFEISETHMTQRVQMMGKSLKILSEDIGDYLTISDLRGFGIIGHDGIEKIKTTAIRTKAEVIVLDPLYKLIEGTENAPEDMREILGCFDDLMEETGAAVMYSHHDPKGTAGDRETRDRGAGSGLLGRDFDACITITEHRKQDGVFVIDTLTRNYKRPPTFSVEWREVEKDVMFFACREDIFPGKKTTETKRKRPPLDSLLPAAKSILESKPLPIATFKEKLQSASLPGGKAISGRTATAFVPWATAEGHLLERKYSRSKLIGLPGSEFPADFPTDLPAP